jgi:hypothetical protein
MTEIGAAAADISRVPTQNALVEEAVTLLQ